MSQPKRYFLKMSPTISGIRCETYEHKDGEYVDYSAYAALQAEVERLKAETVKQIEAALPPVEAYIAKLAAENARLKSENNRLRRAGDGLMFEGETMAHEVSWNPAPWDRVVAAWVAAKEGRDAK